MACVIDSTKLFQERIKNLAGKCGEGEKAFLKISKKNSSRMILNTLRFSHLKSQ